MGLFEKSEEKSFGTYADMIILDSVVAPNDYQTTHILIKSTIAAISPGMYEYEPVSGSVSLDGNPIGNLDYKVIMNNNRFRKIIELYKHAPTWKEWIEKGKVEENGNKSESENKGRLIDTIKIKKKKKKKKKNNSPKVFIIGL